MTDECKGCQVRGNLEACESTECSIHDSWYVRELKKSTKRLDTNCTSCKGSGEEHICLKCLKGIAHPFTECEFTSIKCRTCR